MDHTEPRPPDIPDRDTLGPLLERHGYRLVWREHAWTEVLATREGENWLGRGITSGEALADLVARMCPSRLGRNLLLQACGEPAVEPAPEPLEAEAGNRVIHREPAPAGPDPEAAGEHAGGSGPAGITRIAEAGSGAAPAEPDSANELLVALESLNGLIQEIREQLPRLHLSAPPRIRAAVRYWIAVARSWEDRLPWNQQVSGRVQQVAQLLGRVCADLWPGTVPSLRIDATPYEATRGRCVTWTEVAAHEERRIRDLDSQRTSQGLDEYGFGDSGFGSPRPADPEAILAGTEGMLAGAGPDLQGKLPVGTLTKAAARLRWIRSHRPDPIRWGKAMGLLRRQYVQLPEAQRGLLGQWLDPAFTPSAPWGQILDTGDLDTENRYRHQKALEQFAELMDSLPDDATDRDTLLSWIVAAGAHLAGAEIAGLLEPVSAAVLALDPECAEDRGVRRRLRRLQALLSHEPGPAEDPDGSGHEPEDEEETPPITEAARELELLRARVRAQVSGKRALLISNRVDHQLADRLEGDLGILLEIDEASPRRIDAAAERIQHGTVDLLLYATGFASHKDVNKLAGAARLAKVPFIKVARGRPQACLLALARDLGLN